MSIEDKMNEFLPGIAPGQVEHLHVAADGAVSRWWLVPGCGAPSIHTPGVTDHGLPDGTAPGWYLADGTPLPQDPRR